VPISATRRDPFVSNSASVDQWILAQFPIGFLTLFGTDVIAESCGAQSANGASLGTLGDDLCFPCGD
jgi:hypothetical protein